jgi:hypothetical protein
MKKSTKTTADAGDSLGPTNSLEDLLSRIRVYLTTKGDMSRQQVTKRMGDLGWTANVIARSLPKRRSRVRLSELIEGEARFGKHLNDGTPISLQRKATLRALRNRLIRYAREFGLFHESFQINDDWSQIRAAVWRVQGGPAIVKAAIRQGRRPSEFSEADLKAWGDERKRKNRTYVYVQMAQSGFRAAIRRSGLEGQLPLLNCGRRTRPQYRIKIADLPSKLREELEGVFACLNKHRQEQALMYR